MTLSRRRISRTRLLVVSLTAACLAAGSLQSVAFAATATKHKAPKPYAGQPVTVTHWSPPVPRATAAPAEWAPQPAAVPAAGSYSLQLAAAPARSAMSALGVASVRPIAAGAWAPIGTSGLAARTNAATAQQVKVAVLSAADRHVRGLNGVALSVQRTSGAASTVQVKVPAALVNNLYGGGYAGRVQWVEMPATGSNTTPIAVSAISRDSSGNTFITAPVSGRTIVIAATSAANSAKGGGTYAATDLKPSGQWGVSTQSGSFTYSYPMATPPAAAGPAPNLSLSYDSGSVDGETSSTNNEPSAVGEGWSLTGGGFIERKYVSCSEDTGASGPVTTSGDLCWKSDNGVLSFAGHSGTLVKDANPGEWRLQNDDGTLVKELTTCTTVTFRNDCWEVITSDGTQYYFGMNHLPGYTSDTATPPTNSVWTVPVFGNDAGEPGYNGTGGTAKGTFATEAKTEAWRWNLDYVVDPHGNAEALHYAKETNFYAQNGSGGTSYVRGGELTEIDYGMQSGSVYTAGGHGDQVNLAYVERCKTGNTCSSSTPTLMPDVPWDQNCAASPCTGKVSPTFWSEKMLASVTTSVRTTVTGYSTVNTWTLNHDYPATNDTYNPPSLWLSQVQQKGSVSGSGTYGAATITLAPTVFKPSTSGMYNRVWVANDGYTQLAKFRIVEIDTTTGAIDAIQYANPDPACVSTYTATLKSSPDSDTHRCFLQWWTPQVTPPVAAQADLFHKYVVQIVTEDPHTGGVNDLRTETDYSYGSPAWRYDTSPFTVNKYRGWSDFAGFSTAEVRKGDSGTPAAQQVSDYTYYQGMDGDHMNDGTTRSAVVTDSSGAHVTDSRWLAGQVREAITPNPVGGTPLSDVLSTPWASTVHADDGTLQSRIVDDGEVKTTTALAAGGTQTVDVHTTRDDNTGLVRTVSNDSTNAGSTCTRTDYAQNTTTWLMDYPSEVATVAQPCGTPPTYPADAISDILTYYDGAALGAAPTKGDVTTVKRVTAYTGTGTDPRIMQITATNLYDGLGRVIQVTDQDGRVSKTAYNPNASGVNQTTQPVTAVTTTTDAQTNGLNWVSKATYNPAWHAQISATDLNNEITTITYDALGRRSQVWLADRPQASYPSAPTTSYAYTDYAPATPAPLAVATTTLTPTGGTVTSYVLSDGLGRARQTQSWSESKNSSGNHILAGTVVTDTFYDSVGRVYLTSSPYGAINSSPSTALIQPGTAVPGQVQTTYDGAGRKTADIQLVNGTEVWRTSYAYSGSNRTDVTPPTGGTPTTTLTDARGRTTQLWQYDNTIPTGTPLATSYTYDGRGDMHTMTDASTHNTWTWTYNTLGLLSKAVDPDTGTTDTTYDDVDRVSTVESDARLTSGSTPARVTLAYKYDDANRKTGEYLNTTSGTQLAGWNYDGAGLPKGQLASSSSYANGDTFTNEITSYDALYRPLTTDTKISTDAALGAFSGTTYSHALDYNPDGSLDGVTDDAMGGLPAEYLSTSYTALGNPVIYGGYTTYLANDSFTNTNLLSQEIGSNGATELQRTFYYSTGTNRLNRLLTTTSASSHFTPADNNFTYDNAGNVTSDTTNADSGNTVQCFSYDHLVEITAAWTLASGACSSEPTAASSVGGIAPYWTDYHYDKATGNRTSTVQHNLTGGTDTTATYNYPAAGSAQPHVLGSITYSGGRTGSDTFGSDPAGEATTRPGQSLTYTPQGRLNTVAASASTQSNIYDADGNLLLTLDQAHGNTLYLGDTQLHTPAGQPSGTVTGVRTYAVLGAPIAERSTTIGGPANGTLVWLNADRNNTITDELDSNTLATTTRHYDPFGNQLGAAPPWTSTHTYLNGDTNAQSNTVHLGARDYDPNLGRFLTADPILSPSDPQQNNRYSYSHNTPITSSDASGLHQECDGPCHGSDNSAGSAQSVGLVGGAGGSASDLKVINISPDVSVLKTAPGANQLAKAFAAYAASVGYSGPRGNPYGDFINEAETWASFCNTSGYKLCGNNLTYEWNTAYREARSVMGSVKFGRGLEGLPTDVTIKQYIIGCGQSFRADTRVVLGDGSVKAIRDVRPGDRVKTFANDRRSVGIKRVLQVMVKNEGSLLDLTIAGPHRSTSVVHTTANHPIWSTSRSKWVDADKLGAKDRLLSPLGVNVIVQQKTPVSGKSDMWDLTVEGDHDFFVTSTDDQREAVLVHNCNSEEQQLYERAVAARDDLAVTKGYKATLIGGYNLETGKVVAGYNGGSDGCWGCAENSVYQQLGGDKSSARFTLPWRYRTGQAVPVCVTCQGKYDKSQFPKGTPYDEGGAWSEDDIGGFQGGELK
ncbi:MAG TPA: polymorphic toxin-type HINT domain-containing protein [Jatrophihabitans sp.]|nr:polymorphic toxin-type HINT domain-containing protein [Jatrophihabitans sp.]